VEAKTCGDPIQLIHDTFEDVIRYNRRRMDSGTKEFDQQSLSGIEYLSCSKTVKENIEPKVS
jgi:hypothetical protein